MTTQKAAPRINPAEFNPARAEARPLALETLRRAVAEWGRAKADRSAAQARYEASGSHDPGGAYEEGHEWERWVEALCFFASDAEARLTTCLLMITGRVDWPLGVKSLENGWKPAAFELDGAHYVVAPTDEDDDPKPKLTVVGVGDFCSEGGGN